METEHIFTESFKEKMLGKGPWVQEPDWVSFEHEGVSCRISRTFHPDKPLGHLCGYCYAPKDHPWAGKESLKINSQVHGGITMLEQEEHGLIIGFDCSHPDDLVPGVEKFLEECPTDEFVVLKKLRDSFASDLNIEKTYKDIDFVIAECKKLAKEILSVA